MLSNFMIIMKLMFLFLDEEEFLIKIDCSSRSQYYFTIEDQMRKMYYNNSHNILSTLNIRFEQETIDNMIILMDALNLNNKVLKTEVDLLKHTENVPNNEKVKIENWIKWLTQSGCGRETIFFNFFKVLNIFVVIPVASCICKRSFSKLSIVKSKLCSTMKQAYLDGLLIMFI